MAHTRILAGYAAACLLAAPAWADPTVNLAPITLDGTTDTSAPDAPAPNALAPDALAPGQDYAFHGQSTFTEQYHPAFASAFRGPNSLDPGSRGDETWDATLYAGWRPWAGAQIWLSPEIDQGFGLSNTLGFGRLFQRRGLQGRLRRPLCAHSAALFAANHRSGRRHPNRGARSEPRSAAARAPTGWCGGSANSASTACSIPTASLTIRATTS